MKALRKPGRAAALVRLAVLLLGYWALFSCAGAGGAQSTNPNPNPSPQPAAVGENPRFVSPAGNDGNDGSAGSPWATLQRAAATAAPGMTIHVAPGIYNGAIVTGASGSPGARIRYLSDQQWGAQIRANGPEAVWLNSGSYVDIVGFDVSGASRIGIENDASFVSILGNRVHDVFATPDEQGGAGIVHAEPGASDNDTEGNMVFNVGRGHGIYHSNLRGRVVNNLVFQVDGWGIHLWHAANNVLVANNTLFNDLSGGIVVGAGDAPGGVTDDNTKAMNNIVVGCPFGLLEFGSFGAHNLFSHNLVFASPNPVEVLAGQQVDTITADPGFVNYTGGPSGDYHLRPGSPAIDAGDPSFAPAIDFSGGARPVGNGYDLGAYEFGSSPAQWPWY
jgi:hypothetical protein